MPNVLFVSKNNLFEEDLRSQLAAHAKDFQLISETDNAMPDIIAVDEDIKKLEELHNQNLPAPFFFITSKPEDAKSSLRINHLIVKPFVLDAFLNELQSCLNIYENSENGYLIFNRYIVRPIKKDIFNQRNGELIKLTEKEVAVLKYLYKAKDRLVTKNELLQEVWGYAPDVSTHTIETHVYRLRQKVELDDSDPENQLILTVDGGYQLKV